MALNNHAKVVADISVFQYSNYLYLSRLYNANMHGLMVKLTEGTGYTNPVAAYQIVNGLKVQAKHHQVPQVGVYHFFHGYGNAEANHFLAVMREFHLDKSTVVALDVEDPTLPTYPAYQMNVFFNRVRKAGFHNLVIYCSGSWLVPNYGHYINPRACNVNNFWVAAYGPEVPYLARNGAWQFTDNYHGLCDASLDYGSILYLKTSKSHKKPAKRANKPIKRAKKPAHKVARKPVKKPAKRKPAKVNKPRASYWSTKGTYVVTANDISLYYNVGLTHHNGFDFGKGTKIPAVPVKYGKIYRLKTLFGYLSANKKWVKLVK